MESVVRSVGVKCCESGMLCCGMKKCGNCVG